VIVAFALLLVLHGLIHLLGTAKAFGWAELPQLTQPITPFAGTLWLVAGVLFLATAPLLFLWPRGWWLIGVCAVILSTSLIVSSWPDAKFGALANAIVVLGVVFGFLAQGPYSLRAEYEHDVTSRLRDSAPAPAVTDADLAHLPTPVRQYLRVAGVVGQPRVRNFRVRIHGRIRGGPDARWMPLHAEQFNCVDDAARLFYLNASMLTIPVQGYHRYVGRSASMRVKAAALVPVASAAGGVMTRSEIVTLFNDMCVLAPATLIDPAIRWELVGTRIADATFTNAGHAIRARLIFRDSGELSDFVSDDRSQTSRDGTTLRRLRWSTPLGAYRSFGAVRLASTGEGWWHEPNGEYAYLQLTIDDVQYNVHSQ